MMGAEKLTQATNKTLELLKLFASYMVIFIHVRFSGSFGGALVAVARFAVPFFFLISGFYSYQITTEKIKKRILSILKFILIATVSYTLYDILELLVNRNANEILDYFDSYTNIYVLSKFFLLNVSISSVHTWYLFAILYVYIIYFVIIKFHWSEKITSTIPIILLVLNLVLGEVFSLFGIVLPATLLRNFMFMGIPFFGLGLLAKKYEFTLCRVSSYAIIITSFLGVLMSVCSYFYIAKNELYIGSLLIVFSMVLIFLKYPTIKYFSFIDGLKGCSTYIYIFHIMIDQIITKLYVKLEINFETAIFLKSIHPLIVCIFSTVLAKIIIEVINSGSKKKLERG